MVNIKRKEEKRMLNEPGQYIHVAGERLNVTNVVKQNCTISFKPNWITITGNEINWQLNKLTGYFPVSPEAWVRTPLLPPIM